MRKICVQRNVFQIKCYIILQQQQQQHNHKNVKELFSNKNKTVALMHKTLNTFLGSVSWKFKRPLRFVTQNAEQVQVQAQAQAQAQSLVQVVISMNGFPTSFFLNHFFSIQNDVY